MSLEMFKKYFTTNEKLNKFVIIFIKFGWPIIVNGIGLNCLFPIFKFWDHSIAVLQYTLTPGLTLFLAVKFKELNKSRSFPIVLALIYVIYTVCQINSWTIKQLETAKLVFLLSDFRIYYLIFLFSVVESMYAIYYLWNNCNYKELFSFRKITFKINLDYKTVRWAKKSLRFLLKQVRLCLKFKELILAVSFLLIMYVCWFKNYFFLAPDANHNQFINYIQILAIPLGMNFVALFLYRPLGLINRFSLILYSLTSVIAGIYGIIQYIIYYYCHLPIETIKKNPMKTLKYIGIFLNNPNSWVCLIDALVGAVGIYIIVKYGIARNKLKRSVNFGSSKFLDLNGVKQLNSPEGIPIGATPKVSNWNDLPSIINSIKKHGGDELIKIKTNHTTLIAPSRSGKGTGVIIPTLLDYKGPVFVTDIKGENYCITARARGKQGRQVYAFDPFNITSGDGVTINPLDFLINNGSIVTNAQIFADLMCPVNAKDSAEARHFQEQAGLILQCLCLYVAYTPATRNKTLAKVYDLLCEEKNPLALFNKIAENQELGDGVVAKLANRILGIHPRELSSILTTAYSCIKFVNIPEIRQATSSSSISLSDITKGDFDLFICIPPKHLPTQQRLLRLITGIIFTIIQDAQGSIGEHNILMLLDEMPALGYMKQIEQMLSYGAGYGVSLLAVSQTIGFLKNIYPDTWDSFFSNQLSIFFGCNDPLTAEFIAKKIGKTTIETSAISESAGTQKSSSTTPRSESVQSANSSSETGRDLLMPDEIQRLGNNVVLAFNAGEPPVLCSRINYWERAEWATMWDINPLHENRKPISRHYTIQQYIGVVWQVLTS